MKAAQAATDSTVPQPFALAVVEAVKAELAVQVKAVAEAEPVATQTIPARQFVTQAAAAEATAELEAQEPQRAAVATVAITPLGRTAPQTQEAAVEVLATPATAEAADRASSL